jgi:deoxyribodipyrimidine photo-lyase
MFPGNLKEIKHRIAQIDPLKYARTRNYKDGSVTKLSPYIARGVISTRQVYDHLLSLELPWNIIEKLVQELAWRDYWQQIWIDKKNEIDRDLKNIQQRVSNHQIPLAVINHNTEITAIDKAIEALYETGYMHNHMRMYVAALSCNIAQSHWLQPAQWMYSHLLDGDWASNALSWQWVAGTNADKKYYANQKNINKYFYSNQKNTYLDIEYSQFDTLEIPDVLKKTVSFDGQTPLPVFDKEQFEPHKQTLIYNYYNLDPEWHLLDDVQRVLLMEPSFFRKYPVSQKCIDFVLQLSENIPGIKIFIGEFHELEQAINGEFLVYKEHPTNDHYQGTEEPREWMFDVWGYYPSFFAYWKKCKKELR